MKVLVTGGAGYIGSVAVEQLITAGHAVVVFDNLSQGHRAAVHPRADFVLGDLSDRAAVDHLLSQHRPEAVMHFASNTLVGESMQKPFMYLGDNVRNGLNLIESMVEHGVLKIILSSTANLFDRPERMPIDEQNVIVPGSPYGESKYMLERILHWADRVCGLRFAALRYFNAAGATETRGEDHTPEYHLIPLVLQVALGQRENITVFGDDYNTPDGSCVRDYIHVYDLAQAHLLALDALDNKSSAAGGSDKSGSSQIYNLGNGTGFSVKQVIETAREITGHAIPAKIGARRPGDPGTLVASSVAIRTALGWQPKYPDLRSIIATAWDWHRKHPQGYSR